MVSRFTIQIKQENSSMEFERLEWSIHPNPLNPEDQCIGLIRLAVPEKLNSIGPTMSLELDYLCDQIKRKNDIQVVIC